MVREGGCHCGAVRFRTQGEPRRAGLCHCSDCRRHSAAPVVGWAVFRNEQVHSTGEVATYESSQHGRRQFCPKCGTSLFYLNDLVFNGLVDIPIAAFDEPDSLPPTEQIQVAERIGWMTTINSLPAYERFPPE
jgi:hypothetical protein